MQVNLHNKENHIHYIYIYGCVHFVSDRNASGTMLRAELGSFANITYSSLDSYIH
jgi:hypothetical protein